MSATNPQWKKVERIYAAKLGGRRLWLSRPERKGGGDIEHPRLRVEVKHTPTMGFRAARGLLASMPRDDGKIPVVGHKMKRAKGADSFRCYLDGADLWALLWTAPSHAGEAALVHDAGADRARGVMVSLALEDLARIVGRR